MTAERRSALHAFRERLDSRSARTGGAVALRELPFRAQVDLRVDPEDTALAGALERALGVALPRTPNTFATGSGRAAIWLGPDEWLVAGPPGSEAQLSGLLHEAVGEGRGSVVDVSAARTTIELAGACARELLEQGCSLDLHPRAFGPGRCAQTLLARAEVVILQLDAAPVYRMLVRPSLAGYLAEWLLDAAEEYAAPAGG